MGRLILYRLAAAVPLLFLVSVITFVLADLAPGNVAATILGTEATPEQIDELSRELGLDQPVWVQYWNWLVNALHGDFGESVVKHQPVTEAVLARLPATLSLVIIGTIIASVLGVGLGIISARRGGAVGRGIDALAMLGFAVPSFWLAYIFVAVFAVQLRLLPATGYVDAAQDLAGWARSLALPVLTLAIIGLTGIAKQTRDSMLETLSRDFIVALRAERISERRIVYRHGLRNAAIPIVTMIGTLSIAMLGMSVLIETVFAVPGLGTLAVSSAQGGDLTMLQGIVIAYCVIVIVVNLLVDIAYGWLNPKTKVAT